MPPLKKSLGEVLMAIALVGALIRTQLDEVPGHYRMFVGAAEALWRNERAYDVPWVGNLFFYSPGCAMFFFGPLSLLPERLGLFIYLALSAAVFWIGLVRFSRLLLPRDRMNLLWVLLFTHFFSGLVAHKVELFSAGIFFLACEAWVRGRGGFLAGFLMGAIATWKLQPIPALGLACLAAVPYRRDWMKLWAGVASGLAVSLALPFAFLPLSYGVQEHQAWLASLNRYSSESYDSYDNLFALAKNTFGIAISFEASKRITLAAAALAAGLMIAWLRKFARDPSRFTLGLAVALAIGYGYTTLLSPLQQVSAYTLFAPVFLLAAYFRESSEGRTRKLWTAGIIATFFVLSISYSGLMPTDLRSWARGTPLRPVACLFLLVATLAAASRQTRLSTPKFS